MARETMGQNIDQGFVARIAQGVRYALTGVGPDSWFGPNQPLAPQAQDKVEGRQFDYPVGVNLRIQPRSEELITFNQLRGFADGYDLMRLIIETRKDQIEAFAWKIVSVEEDASAVMTSTQISQAKIVTDFMQSPDKEHTWAQWLRMVVEELLVIDTVCVYPRMDRGGGLYGFELVDGATIKRLIDDSGRTPLPPDPAYQQILKGIPAADYTRDMLLYTVRNPRVSKLYGYSPVEQVISTVSIALRRQVSQLEYYTAGNIPEAIAQLPKDWTPDNVREFQKWWDSLMEGNTAQQRKMKFIPNIDGILFPKQGVLKDEYDEWLARVVCFAFSIPPTAFIKQNNRATGQQAADTAKEEGLLPLLKFLEDFINTLLRKYAGVVDVKFKWERDNTIDPLSQSTIDSVYLDRKTITPDEVRDRMGLEPLTEEQRNAAWPAPPALTQGVGDGSGQDGTGGVSQRSSVSSGANANADSGIARSDKAVTDAEKMLEMLPALSKAITDGIRAQPPTIIEVKPDVHVEIGDTNVEIPLRKQQDPLLQGKQLVATRRADGSMVAEYQDINKLEKNDATAD